MLWQSKRELVAFALQQIGMVGFSRGVSKTHSDWMLLNVLEWAQKDIGKEAAREVASERADSERCLALQNAMVIVDDAIREIKAAA